MVVCGTVKVQFVGLVGELRPHDATTNGIANTNSQRFMTHVINSE